LFLGGVVGFGLVLASEFLDKSFIDVEEAKERSKRIMALPGLNRRKIGKLSYWKRIGLPTLDQ